MKTLLFDKACLLFYHIDNPYLYKFALDAFIVERKKSDIFSTSKRTPYSQYKHRTKKVYKMPNWVVSALLVAAAVTGGAEARPWSEGKEFPTETGTPAPDTVKQERLEPTLFNIMQEVVERRLRKRQDFPVNVCGFIGGSVGTICSWRLRVVTMMVANRFWFL